MSTYITNTIEGQAAVQDGKWDDVQTEAAKHRRSKITVESYTGAKEWSDQQRKWWKGILLPSLVDATGDSLEYWETTLKLAVQPEIFKPVGVVVNGVGYTYMKSIKILNMHQMNFMVTGSVAHLREYPEYKGMFQWVTEPIKPDKE